MIVVAFVAFATAGFVLRTNANSAMAASNESRRENTARDLFVSNCARCHGLDGAGTTELGRKLHVPDLVKEARGLSAAKITRVITNGRDDMPGFGKKLTKKQISSLAAYIRKL